MNSSLFRIILFLTLTVVPAGGSLHAQCSQPTQEQEAIIREAENDRYTTRRVEFSAIDIREMRCYDVKSTLVYRRVSSSPAAVCFEVYRI